MNIDKISTGAINAIQNFTSSAIKLTKEVPKSDLPVSRWDCPTPMPWEVFEAKKNIYLRKLYDTYFDENGKIIPEIETFLDETIFDLHTGGGQYEKRTTSTIKDYLKSSIHDPSEIKGTLYHGTPRPEKILEEGFNPKYISRTNLGPGFYFADEGVAREYGTAISAKINDTGATCAFADDRFYENLTSGDVTRKLADYLGFSSEFSEESRIQHEFLPKIINEYCRNYIITELGVDALKGNGGATPFDWCTCVLNPDIFEKISIY